MPSWSDDEGRCHFKVDGVPCYQSPVGCPMHRAKEPAKPKTAEAERTSAHRRLVVEAHADALYAALKAYYHECKCQQTSMDTVNQRAYAALRAYEDWNGR